MVGKYIVECSICRDWKNPKSENPNKSYNPHFYTPTIEKRRDHYFSSGKLSHGLCPPCIVQTWRNDGLPESEIQEVVEQALAQEKHRAENSRS